MRPLRACGIGMAWLAASFGTSVAVYATPAFVWHLALLLIGRDVGDKVFILFWAAVIGVAVSIPVYRIVWPDILDGTPWERR